MRDRSNNKSPDVATLIRPRLLHGVRSKTPWINTLYTLTGSLLSLLVKISPSYLTTSAQLGRAMIKVAKDGYDKPILESEDINNVWSVGWPTRPPRVHLSPLAGRGRNSRAARIPGGGAPARGPPRGGAPPGGETMSRAQGKRPPPDTQTAAAMPRPLTSSAAGTAAHQNYL
ncbi:hypothetical protein [Rhodopseudomonas sp. BAL398]|uniref:hypothetical protein n=1 Tax=Rhodopseudomonas sp. BAL398 TaxID=3034676 RepID=UPI0023E34132|nr:hypothetical protein [Rhodopseudomonas sp. BAL398]MDF3809636.1 hypothetical protein [Rhodopseudomonas sp. BAL398]